MIVRIVKVHRKAGRTETDYSCSTLRKVFWDDGIDIILCDVNGDSRQEIKLEMPRDGRRVYIMNGAGDTTDSVSWPPNAKLEEDKSKEDQKADKKSDEPVTEDVEVKLRVMA